MCVCICVLFPTFVLKWYHGLVIYLIISKAERFFNTGTFSAGATTKPYVTLQTLYCVYNMTDQLVISWKNLLI